MFSGNFPVHNIRFSPKGKVAQCEPHDVMATDTVLRLPTFIEAVGL